MHVAARRRTTSSTGRTWAIRCRARSGAAPPRWWSSRSDVNHALNCFFCHDPHVGQAAHRARRPDPGAHAAGEGHPVAQGCARREDRRQGTRRARPHAQDRAARPLRHQAAVRPVPRRVQLQPRHRSDDRPADRHGRPAHQSLPVQGRERDRQALHRPQVPRLQARDHRRLLWKAQHPDVGELLQLEAPEGRRRVPPVPHAEDEGRQDRQDLHVALADHAEALHQGDLPAPATASGARSRRST